MAEALRKIELQEADDLRYLVANLRRAADEKIDLALPPIEGEDALRQKVEELVHGFINQTYTLAAPSLLINGHAPPQPLLSALLSNKPEAEPSEPIQEFEPLNSKLRDRAKRLLAEEEALLVELGQLRRAAPVKAAEAWKAELGKPLDAELDTVKYGEDEAWEKEFTMEKLERQEDVEKAWRAGVEGLGKLKRELPATAARMERAKGAGAYALKE